MNKYTEDRKTRSLPICSKSKITIIFNGHYLFATGAKDGNAFAAASGVRNKDGSFDYSIERQKIHNHGPIPSGEYWISPSELWENNWFKSNVNIPYYRNATPVSSWGNFRLSIHPFIDTETYGRGGFFIHGGTTPGSIGCIDIVKNMDNFVKFLKNELGDNQKCYIQLSVRY